MSKYVIIGNSAAAIGCVEGIRQNDKEGKITIISDESYHTYSRPLISYYLLGKTTEEKMKYRPDDFYNSNNVELILNKKAVKINNKEKCVLLDDGKKIVYDKLLVSTGSSPFVPKMDGLESVDNKHTFASFDDAKNLEKSINENSDVLIVGAGLIGLKCAEGIKKLVKSVTVIDLAPRVLSSILDDDASGVIKEHLENNGVKLYLKDSVKTFKKNKAVLVSGVEIKFDALVLAVGVRANTEIVKDAGGNVGRGITVDNKCMTSLCDVFAAGDCTESVDVSDGNVKVMALLPNAYMQGECAGKNMSGEEYEFNKAIPENSIGLFGKHIITAGSYVGDTYFDDSNNCYKKLYYSDNKLNGFILIGDVSKAGIYTYLVREKIGLDTVDFELIAKNPCLMAFSRQYRNEKLGGVK